jgi:pimeloyl-ACP methyl ester carboxylesterase
MVFLHGILGSGANWRTFAMRLVAERPGWRAVLVDIRKHGGSQDFAPPHTLAACASDLMELEKSIGRFDAVLGHSFGGKVGLEYARLRQGLAPSERREDLDVLWVLDAAPGSNPSRKDSSSDAVVAMLATVPERFDSREAFIAYVEQRGTERPVAMWLAMNVRVRDDGGYAMRLDVPAMRELLDDYFLRDEWPYLEDSQRTTKVHIVVGDRSRSLDRGERALANRVAVGAPDRTWVHVLDAGHWIHIDAPDALFALVAQHT